MQKHVNLVDLVKSFPTNIYLQNLASIQKRTSPVKFAYLAEKSGKGSISNLSTKAPPPEEAGTELGGLSGGGAVEDEEVLASHGVLEEEPKREVPEVQPKPTFFLIPS